MKRLILFVLMACILIPSVAQAKWVIETETVDIGGTFVPDEPKATAKPAPGGGYFLGDGPTIIKPERLTGTTPTPTPEPEIGEPRGAGYPQALSPQC